MDDEVNAQRNGDGSAALMQGWMGLRGRRSAGDLGRNLATLADPADRPPLVRIGRRVFYRADAFREWMIAQERGPVVSKRTGSGR
jgi:hypothetical protein